MKREAAIGLLVIGFGVWASPVLLAQQPAGKKQPGPSKIQEREQSKDSRAFPVEKPCTADEVTIKAGEPATGESEFKGGSCEEAKAKCRANLAKKIKDAAEKECQLYQKVADQGAQCHAHRGNFNPTEGTKDEGCESAGSHWEAKCSSSVAVKYNCN